MSFKKKSHIDSEIEKRKRSYIVGMGTIDVLVLIIVFIEHVLNNLAQKKA